MGWVVVHAHEDLAASAGKPGDRFADGSPRTVLLLWRDGILQIQHHGGGPPEARPLHLW